MSTAAGPNRPGRLDAYGTTVFADMSARAARLGAVNLGQGFPDESGPEEVLEAAARAIANGENQYAPGRGVPVLLEAIAEHAEAYYGQRVDPGTGVLVTAGATEAIAAAVLALCTAGDEVVTFEPYYDSYGATIDLAGARKRVVPLRAEPHPGPDASPTPDTSPTPGASATATPSPAAGGGGGARWGFDADELRRAITERTRMILLNTPHNPTGRVFSHDELQLVADLCCEHDLLAVTDEVYEHLVFDDRGPDGGPERRHERLATFDGMAERTVTISSAGKTFSVTGWKIGWAIGPPQLIDSIKAVKQFLTYTSGTPLQHAVATGLRLPADRLDERRAALQLRRDQLCDGLASLGWSVLRPEATYFANVDIRSVGNGTGDGWQFCDDLVAGVGVAAIPAVVFYDPEHQPAAAHLVRFAFCKREEVIAEALERLSRLPRR